MLPNRILRTRLLSNLELPPDHGRHSDTTPWSPSPSPCRERPSTASTRTPNNRTRREQAARHARAGLGPQGNPATESRATAASGTATSSSAACPERKRAVGHVCSRANTVEMNRHLGDISAAVEPGNHAVVVVDGTGWHKSRDLDIPSNLSLLHLPPYSPELNPMENVFEYLKSNHLANRVFRLVEDVLIGVKMAWLEFEDVPDLIKSITSRKWATADAVNKKSSIIN